MVAGCTVCARCGCIPKKLRNSLQGARQALCGFAVQRGVAQALMLQPRAQQLVLACVVGAGSRVCVLRGFGQKRQ